MTKANGAVIYRGVSRIDNRTPIVVIATGLHRASRNAKTGEMVQTWILRDDVSPFDAMHNRNDAGICGGCPHRRQADGSRSCYVNVANAPMAIYAAFKAGNYPDASLADLPGMFAGRKVRLGAYGDPAAVPAEVWAAVLQNAAGHTGYSHQWKAERLRDVTAFVQASVDSAAEAEKAVSYGLGYFRVKAVHEDTLPGEIVCPASEEAGKLTTCADCQLCSGRGARVVINAHGAGSKHVARRALPVI